MKLHISIQPIIKKDNNIKTLCGQWKQEKDTVTSFFAVHNTYCNPVGNAKKIWNGCSECWVSLLMKEIDKVKTKL
jgi:hypothetical protein